MTYTFDFDKPTDRHNTNSLKWDKYPKGVIPLWVADMDLEVAPAITDALHQRVNHGIFGYTRPTPNWNQVIADYYLREHEWSIEPEWVVWIPGVVASMNLACMALSPDHNRVLTPEIIYPHFHSTPEHWNKIPHHLPMTYAQGRLRLDIDALQQTPTGNAKIMLFCNPQNPGGCVYTRDELEQIEAYCSANDIIVVSDEIHCDLILDQDKRHIPYGSLSERAQNSSIVVGAASKTYNIAGLACSWAIIPNPILREQFVNAKKGIVSEISPLGYQGTITALESCNEWRDQLLDYLRGNCAYLQEAFAAITGIEMLPIESTFLAWLDVSQLPCDDAYQLFINYGVGLSPGDDFNDSRYLRLNFGCQRHLLEKAVSRIKEAVFSLNPV